MFKLYTMILKFHMTMSNNTIFLFQLFSDTESLDCQIVEEIRMEWSKYFIKIRNNKSYLYCYIHIY